MPQPSVTNALLHLHRPAITTPSRRDGDGQFADDTRAH